MGVVILMHGRAESESEISTVVDRPSLLQDCAYTVYMVYPLAV